MCTIFEEMKRTAMMRVDEYDGDDLLMLIERFASKRM